MIPLEETYSGRFFRTRHKLAWRAEPMCKVINDIFHPKSVIDVGCAIGDLVKGFLDLGIDAYGVEGSEEVKPYLVPGSRVFIKDLRNTFPLGLFGTIQKQFDLVTCIEVAEHIEPEYADIFMDNITGMSDKILMSYAGPGQKGHSHVNCQLGNYWIAKFHDRGFTFDTSPVREVLKGLEPWKHKDGIKALFKHNLVYFERIGNESKWDNNPSTPLEDIKRVREMEGK